MSEAVAVHAPQPAPLAPAGEEWTYADLLALPDDGPKCEIVEGSLVVSPSPSAAHQYAIVRLLRAIEDQAPPDVGVLFDLDVDLGRSVFRPDVLVLTRSAAGGHGPLRAADLLLAVEVTSPSSRSMDRIIKPAALAAAGVPNYWRVDLDGAPFVEVFALDGQAYRLTQTLRAGTPGVVPEPFRVEFDPATLVRDR